MPPYAFFNTCITGTAAVLIITVRIARKNCSIKLFFVISHIFISFFNENWSNSFMTERITCLYFYKTEGDATQGLLVLRCHMLRINSRVTQCNSTSQMAGNQSLLNDMPARANSTHISDYTTRLAHAEYCAVQKEIMPYLKHDRKATIDEIRAILDHESDVNLI